MNKRMVPKDAENSFKMDKEKKHHFWVHACVSVYVFYLRKLQNKCGKGMYVMKFSLD